MISSHCPSFEGKELQDLKLEDILDGLHTLIQSVEGKSITTHKNYANDTTLVGIPAESTLFLQKVYHAATCRFYRGIALLYLVIMIKHHFPMLSDKLEDSISTLLERVSRCAGFLNMFKIHKILDVPQIDHISGQSVFCEYYTLLEREFHQERMEGDSQQWEAFLCDRFIDHNTVFLVETLNV